MFELNNKILSYWSNINEFIICNATQEARRNIIELKTLLEKEFNISKETKEGNNELGLSFEMLSVQSLVGKFAKGLAFKDNSLLQETAENIYKKLYIIEKYYISSDFSLV